jgi:hypothetical protein
MSAYTRKPHRLDVAIARLGLHFVARHFLSTGLCTLVLVTTSADAAAVDDDRAFTVFAGRLTKVDVWHDIFTDPGDVKFADSYFAAGALSLSLARFWDKRVGLELEGQVVRHWGDQHLWEFNLPVVARWHRFPWNTWVNTTAAFGLGPSYATKVPDVEVGLEGDSKKFLAHWFMELTLGAPEASWAVSFRLHHRSDAFSLFANEGGSNGLAMGLRLGF